MCVRVHNIQPKFCYWKPLRQRPWYALISRNKGRGLWTKSTILELHCRLTDRNTCSNFPRSRYLVSAVANQGGDLALRRVCRGEAALDGGRPVVHHHVVTNHAHLLAVRLHDLSQQIVSSLVCSLLSTRAPAQAGLLLNPKPWEW